MGWTVMRRWQHDLERDYEASIQSIVAHCEIEGSYVIAIKLMWDYSDANYW